MLIPLLRTYLAPYKRPIALVLTFQLIQTLANLWLPGLNADIIDKGVVQGDTGYIVRTGGDDADGHRDPGRVHDRRGLLRCPHRDGARP